MAMAGSGCSACHSFTGHCPYEASAGLGVLSIRSPSCSAHRAPPQKTQPLPRPYDLGLAYLPAASALHNPISAPVTLASSLHPHMKLPSQGFVPAVPSAVITSPTEARCFSPAGLRQAASLLVSLAGSSPITLSVLGFICLHITLGQANIYFIVTFSVS